jgi:hypothetical protein
MNKLSHSSIQKYLECGRKYRNHYIEKIRPINTKSALVFGSCLDAGLNALHQGKDLQTAKDLFFEAWIVFKDDPNLIFSKADLQEELLQFFQHDKGSSKPELENRAWASILYKGYLMLEACQREVLPLIKRTISSQEAISFKNAEGDEIHGFLDLIVESHEGKIYLIDNKSSSVKYEADSPRKSQQLVLYYYLKKDELHIDEIGFFVYNKKINMQKKKCCNSCQRIVDNKFKTCDNQFLVHDEKRSYKRCNGELTITYNPIAEVELITNEVSPSDEDRVIEDIDKVNQGITNKEFEPNFEACEGKFGRCEYYNLCHNGSMEGLKIVKKEE